MEQNSRIKEILKKHNQEQILETIEKFSNAEKNRIFEQIDRLDLGKIENLYNSLHQKAKVGTDGIEPISALNKDKLSEEEIESYEKAGKSIIKNGKYALVTMSGGQGTRLGYDKAKGTFKVNTCNGDQSLFEILANKLLEEKKKLGVTIPWYIMTSEENNEQIMHFFKENLYFSYPKNDIMFFKQENLPIINEEGKLIIGENKLIKEAANGNGGVFGSLYKNGALDDMKARGVKWIFISSIDNILLKIADKSLIGLAEKRGVEIATKSILRNSPEEKVGAICKSKGNIRVIEYSEMSDEMKNLEDENNEYVYGESHVMCNLFSLKALNILANKELPYHIAHKKMPFLSSDGTITVPSEPNVYKFETFIFDGWNYFNDIAVLRGKREEDFAPIKNKKGVDSPETAVELYNNYYGRK